MCVCVSGNISASEFSSVIREVVLAVFTVVYTYGCVTFGGPAEF